MNPAAASNNQPAPRIGLFGGTFDPVHLGHLAVATEARQALDLTEVRFLPCRQSPHKDSSPTPAEDRVAMLHLALAGLPWAVVDDYELHLDGPSYSVATAEEMAKRFPAARLFWLMGTDQWDALPRWHDPQRLAAIVEFAVYPRGHPPLPRRGYRLHRLSGNHPACATSLRAASADAPDQWLHPEVASYIRRRGLYA